MLNRMMKWLRQETIAAPRKLEPKLRATPAQVNPDSDVIDRANQLMHRLSGHRNGQAF